MFHSVFSLKHNRRHPGDFIGTYNPIGYLSSLFLIFFEIIDFADFSPLGAERVFRVVQGVWSDFCFTPLNRRSAATSRGYSDFLNRNRFVGDET